MHDMLPRRAQYAEQQEALTHEMKAGVTAAIFCVLLGVSVRA
jgi:hypothetical protein